MKLSVLNSAYNLTKASCVLDVLYLHVCHTMHTVPLIFLPSSSESLLFSLSSRQSFPSLFLGDSRSRLFQWDSRSFRSFWETVILFYLSVSGRESFLFLFLGDSRPLSLHDNRWTVFHHFPFLIMSDSSSFTLNPPFWKMDIHFSVPSAWETNFRFLFCGNAVTLSFIASFYETAFILTVWAERHPLFPLFWELVVIPSLLRPSFRLLERQRTFQIQWSWLGVLEFDLFRAGFDLVLGLEEGIGLVLP